MTGRRLCSEEEAIQRGFSGADCARRREVLRETIAAFGKSDPSDRYHRLAEHNLERWRAASDTAESRLRVDVVPGDWGAVTRSLTRTHGMCFAALNMANAYVPGGASVARRIAAQLDTSRDHRIRHVVLGAFGCGAFCNPAHRVAQIYQEEISTRAQDLSVVTFAVFSAGYGPDNFTPFSRAFRRE